MTRLSAETFRKQPIGDIGNGIDYVYVYGLVIPLLTPIISISGHTTAKERHESSTKLRAEPGESEAAI